MTQHTTLLLKMNLIENHGSMTFVDIIKQESISLRQMKIRRGQFEGYLLGYFPSGEVLYKRNYDGELLRCINIKEAKKILFKIHEGNCMTNASGHIIAKKILQQGYFWPTMEKDFIGYIQKCRKC